ncbi:MAG: hypothetical protein WCP45_13520 [Verrucomicrobiota bacterium]
MKTTPAAFPPITAKIEVVTPAKAKAWLETMSPNRKVKDSSVAMYASDMANGNWKISPQGIAFDDGKALFDGQHRLLAVIRCGLSVPLLVLRGFPTLQGKMKTMDVVDCGAIRSLPDRLKLMGCYAGNPNLVCAIARQIAMIAIGKNSRATRRISLATTLEIIGLWSAEITQVAVVLDRSTFRPGRNAGVAAAFVLAAATCPNKTRDALAQLSTGANLDHGSPLLELRNALISGRAGDNSDRAIYCLSALLCQWHKLPGSQVFKDANKAPAEKYFRDKNQARFDRLAKLFLVKDENAGVMGSAPRPESSP